MGTALVTGASSGLGLEFAWQLAAARHDLVLVARRGPVLEEIAEELRQAAGVRVEVLPADLAQRDGVDAVAERLRSPEPPVGLLVNNAGFGLGQGFVGGDLAREEEALDVLVRAVLVLSHAAAPAMVARGHGAILNVSSVGGVRSFRSVGWYNATKFAVEGLSEALEQEVAPLGIRVVLIEPSGFATDWAGSSAAETRPEAVIADYDATAGANRRSFRANAGNEAGDPARAAVAIVNVAHEASPPKRLPLGNYAYDGLLEKLDMVRADIAQRESISRGADRPQA